MGEKGRLLLARVQSPEGGLVDEGGGGFAGHFYEDCRKGGGVSSSEGKTDGSPSHGRAVSYIKTQQRSDHIVGLKSEFLFHSGSKKRLQLTEKMVKQRERERERERGGGE